MSRPAESATNPAAHEANENQRLAADPRHSVWVGASAGSGKTKVLTDRVLRLLLDENEPTKILCLTYTKAAAAEMKNRLADKLSGWASASAASLETDLTDLLGRPPRSEESERARRLFAAVLDAPGGMKIQTIHSFCQSMLARFPLEAGVAPHFTLLDERGEAEALAEAREAVLEAAGREALPIKNDLAVLAARSAEQSLVDLLKQLAGERDRIARFIARGGGLEGAKAAILKALGFESEKEASAARDALWRQAASDYAGLAKVCKVLLSEGGKTDRKHAEYLQPFIEAGAKTRPALLPNYLKVFFDTKGDPRDKLATKAILDNHPDVKAVLDDEAMRVADLVNRARAAEEALGTAALIGVGWHVLKAYEQIKTRNAALDYGDQILKARDLLASQGLAGWVLYKLDEGIDHMLVDEAQDTNPEQWEVVKHLTAEFFAGEGAAEARREADKPRTIFAVGDPKQSIFGFQGAAPEKFAETRDHYRRVVRQAEQSFVDVPLAVSFRSAPAVLAAVDAVFEGEAERAALLAGEERIAHRATRGKLEGLVELWPPAPGDGAPDAEPWSPPVAREDARPGYRKLADLLAERIRLWCLSPEGADDPLGWHDEQPRRLSPGDIMVLVQSRGVFVNALLRALIGAGVPVAGVDRMMLGEELSVLDLTALGEFLLMPEDDLALACVLKSPLVGLDDDDLMDLAIGRGETTLWRALRDKAGSERRYEEAARWLSALLAEADYTPPYELFASVLGRAGRRRMVSRLGQQASDPLDEFLNLALAYSEQHPPSLQGFLHWLAASDTQVKREMERAGGKLRIITVHSAKGLEAPVVILADAHRAARTGGGPSQQVVWYPPEPGNEAAVPIWPLAKAERGNLAIKAMDAKEAAERRERQRLLYVAMTRAEDRLIVTGWREAKDLAEDCWYRQVEGALGDRAAPLAFDASTEIAGGWCGEGLRLGAPSPIPEKAEAAPAMATPAALPAWASAEAPAERKPPQPLSPSKATESEPPLRSPLGEDQGYRFKRGLLIHRLLEILPALAPERWEDTGKRFLARPLHALSEAEQQAYLAETLAVMRAYPQLFGPDSRAEVSISGLLKDARVVSGQVDRLVVGERAVEIVDFKTNRPPPADPQDAPLAYVKQMATYRAVLEGVYPEREIRCHLLWTDGPDLMTLPEALLAAGSP